MPGDPFRRYQLLAAAGREQSLVARGEHKQLLGTPHAVTMLAGRFHHIGRAKGVEADAADFPCGRPHWFLALLFRRCSRRSGLASSSLVSVVTGGGGVGGVEFHPAVSDWLGESFRYPSCVLLAEPHSEDPVLHYLNLLRPPILHDGAVMVISAARVLSPKKSDFSHHYVENSVTPTTGSMARCSRPGRRGPRPHCEVMMLVGEAALLGLSS